MLQNSHISCLVSYMGLKRDETSYLKKDRVCSMQARYVYTPGLLKLNLATLHP